MRDEFYSDGKDVVKWTIINDEAGKHRPVFYIVMKRPNENKGHGLSHKKVGSEANVAIEEFFQKERLNGTKDLKRIKQLEVKGFLEAVIEIKDNIYEHSKRCEYFNEVINALNIFLPDTKRIVFLDPDNGIGGKAPNSRHVCIEQMADLWEAMNNGDTLIVYQHQFRDKEWANKRAFMLAAAIDREIKQDQIRKFSSVHDVCFFVVTK